jgi:hypothetical protein
MRRMLIVPTLSALGLALTSCSFVGGDDDEPATDGDGNPSPS